jgi:hypothetical protein
MGFAQNDPIGAVVDCADLGYEAVQNGGGARVLPDLPSSLSVMPAGERDTRAAASPCVPVARAVAVGSAAAYPPARIARYLQGRRPASSHRLRPAPSRPRRSASPATRSALKQVPGGPAAVFIAA